MRFQNEFTKTMNGITGQLNNGAMTNGLSGAGIVSRLAVASGTSVAAPVSLRPDHQQNLNLRNWEQGSEYCPEVPVPSPPQTERAA